MFIYIWNIMDYFFIVKVVVASPLQVKCFMSLLINVTANTHCDNTMARWRCLDTYVMSQWVCDVTIDTNQSCEQPLGSFTQDPGKPGTFTQDPGGMKTNIFHLKAWI